jgi:hypothetical protein
MGNSKEVQNCADNSTYRGTWKLFSEARLKIFSV